MLTGTKSLNHTEVWKNCTNALVLSPLVRSVSFSISRTLKRCVTGQVSGTWVRTRSYHPFVVLNNKVALVRV